MLTILIFYGNVISLDLRTSVKISESGENNLNYVKMLNGVLPEDIRILAQAKVHEQFNARYDTKSRIYKYFFVIDNMNIDKIKVNSFDNIYRKLQSS